MELSYEKMKKMRIELDKGIREFMFEAKKDGALKPELVTRTKNLMKISLRAYEKPLTINNLQMMREGVLVSIVALGQETFIEDSSHAKLMMILAVIQSIIDEEKEKLTSNLPE